jgi:hypothetical protein
MALNVIRKPLAKLKRLKQPSQSSERLYTDGQKANGTATANGPQKKHDAKEIAEERRKRSASRKRKNARHTNRDAVSKWINQKFMEMEEEDGAALYKPFSMNMSKRRENEERFLFKDLDVTGKGFFRPLLELPAPIHHVGCTESYANLDLFRDGW